MMSGLFSLCYGIFKSKGGGWGGETRSGTKKRCSHNLQSGHPEWWSADNFSSFFPIVNILIEARCEPAEEMIKKLKTIVSCILAYFSCISYLSYGTEIVRETKMQLC